MPPPPEGANSTRVDATPRVWVLENGQPVKVVVQRGLSDGVSTEVQGDLREGQVVITDAEQGGAR